MGAGNRAEDEDQNHQPGASGDGITEEHNSGITGGKRPRP